MKTISVISQKGGSGKTTLAVHLGAAATAAGYVSLIVDTDPQATACSWRAWRGDRDPDVIDCGAPSLLRRKLDQAAELGAEVAIVDTPPHADAMARAACDAADLVLVPCRPRAFDLDAIRTTAGLVLATGKPSFVIFTGGPPNASTLYGEAIEVVAGFGLKVAPVMMPERAVLHRVVGSGQVAAEAEPDGKAAAEVVALWTFICEHVAVLARKQGVFS